MLWPEILDTLRDQGALAHSPELLLDAEEDVHESIDFAVGKTVRLGHRWDFVQLANVLDHDLSASHLTVFVKLDRSLLEDIHTL